jgi:hypothetical protein
MPHGTANTFFAQMDSRFSGANARANIDAALKALRSGVSLEQLAEARVGKDPAQHFQQDWLSAWPQAEQKLRQGLIQALTLCQQTGLPLHTTTAAVAAGQPFQVVVEQQANQISLKIKTPPV